MADPAEQVQPKLNMQMILAFLFGIVFILLILWIVYQAPGDDRFKKMVILVILSLAAAGVGAILPGYIVAGAPNKLVRAGGALAVFIVVLYFGSTYIPTTQEAYLPTSDPSTVANEFTESLDSANFEKAYALTSATFRAGITKYMFQESSKRISAKLGTAQNRSMVFQNTVKSPVGFPPGAYCFTNYILRPAGKQSEVYLNMILVGDQEDKDWRIFNVMYSYKNPQGNLLPVDFLSAVPIP